METTNPYVNLAGITPEELIILQQTTVGLNQAEQNYFLNSYSAKRRSPENVMIFCIIGIVIPGIQRFILDQIAWAVLYFFTGGLFFVMTVMDLLNYKKLSLEFNQKMAYESLQMAKMAAK